MPSRPNPVDPLVVKKQNLLRLFYAIAVGCAAAFALAQYSHNLQRDALLALALLGSVLAIWTLLRFLRVIDEHTLGFADFKGNRQYITTGNLAENDKAFIFIMDYAQRRRVKL